MLVSDSTSLILFSKIQKLELLKKLFKKLIIPKAVWSEVVVEGERRGYIEAEIVKKHLEDWIELRELTPKQLVEKGEITKVAPLGAGEAESIVLASALRASLLTDDALATKFAKVYGLKTYWSTTVILKALKKRLITKKEAKNLLEELIRSGLRIKPDVLIELLKIMS